MPAARSARRCSSWHQLLDKPRDASARTDRQKGSFLGPRIHAGRDLRASSTSVGAQYRARPATSRADGAGRATCSSTARSSAGSRAGWNSARARSAARSILGDPALAEDAGDDEPEDQVPRELPPVRADACSQDEAHEWFELEPGRKVRTCCSSRRCSSEHRVPITDEQRRDDGERPGPAQPRQRAALDDPGRDARRLQRARSDGGRRRATRG